jgi:tetratricopeptide (TPR) repeat protein
MNRLQLQIAAVLLTLLLGAGWTLAQTDADQARKMVQGYDLLEAGKMRQAQQFYEEILKQEPGNPLALNNLAAIMVNKQKYKEALAYLEEALPQAQDYKVRVNRVCDVEGICLAFRPLENVYGNQDLVPLIKLNIAMVKDRLKATPGAK